MTNPLRPCEVRGTAGKHPPSTAKIRDEKVVVKLFTSSDLVPISPDHLTVLHQHNTDDGLRRRRKNRWSVLVSPVIEQYRTTTRKSDSPK